MKERKVKKNATMDTPQLDLFTAPQAPTPAPDNVPQASKVVSMADHKHLQDVKAFYEIATKLTSHLK